jgi:hypothetical protein
MATAAQIRDKAGFKLGVKALGQALENSVSSDLDDAYTEVYNRLRDEDLVSWDISAEVPDEVVSPVVDLVAIARVDEYGVSGERYQRISIAASQAEIRIRRSLQDDYFTNENEAVYF